jgi:glutamate/tyrosine decarboxylase-like PLP-dependent enzyme
MKHANGLERLRKRSAALELPPDSFREIGHRLVDQLADFLAELPSRAVTPAERPAEVRAAIGALRSLPEAGRGPAAIAAEAAELLIDHSLFNGHPRFFGYITSSAAPIGALGDLIASVINCNVGAWKLSPAASEIEAQTVRWISEFIGYRPDCGGLLVSGGNMANFVGFLAARAAAGGPELRKEGVRASKPLRCYCSRETHTWIQKAADMAGLGTDSVRWIACDDCQGMDVAALRREVEQDIERGDQPFLVVGTAGSVSTGAIDPLPELAAFCRETGIWFHVDGAYGGLAACVPGAPEELQGLALADSVAVDPHKWLYAPVEAGCTLVRDPKLLLNAFSYRPPYYNFDTDAINYFDLGPQNSRGFRALKIWMAFQQAGRSGFQQTIADDIALAEHAFRLFSAHPEFEAVTCNLSICTFRYVPATLRALPASAETEALINRLNQSLLGEIETSGSAFLSNAVVDGRYLLRMCVVNFRTSLEDIEALPGLIGEIGARTFAAMQKEGAAAL